MTNEEERSVRDQRNKWKQDHAGNDCKYCGMGNEGSVVEGPDGSPLVIHYGLWHQYYHEDGSRTEVCAYCNRRTEHPARLSS